MQLLKFFLITEFFAFWMTTNLIAQQVTSRNQALSARQQNIVTISSFTAKGDLVKLKTALSNGLDAGLTVNEIKEGLVHLYAYCGFPRSLQGLNTFITVLDARKAKGITDKVGKEATPVKSTETKYQQGKKVLETLTGKPEIGPKPGYATFSPEIEVYLKEHLFAAIFTRDILSYTDREVATIAALINLGDVEPMLKSHLGIALNLGITENELRDMFALIETKVGKQEAESGRKVLQSVLDIQQSSNLITGTNQHGKANPDENIFSKGIRIANNNFSGPAWVQMLVDNDNTFNTSIGNITFEPGTRTKWHYHPGGQILLVVSGKGRYQEKGKAVRELRKGDVIKCSPNITHWHGASPDNELSHIAVGTNMQSGSVVWLEPVTDEEYTSKIKP